MEEPAAGYLSPVVLQKGAALLALVLVAGCGSSIASDTPEPVTRHLVYDKVRETGISRLLVRDGGSPAISPDGKWVAYLDDSVGNLYVVPSSGSKPKLLARGLYSTVIWSPNSERIAARLHGDDWDSSGPRRGDEALVSIDVASGDQVTLARGDAPWGWSFSPDSKRIVYAMTHGSNPDRFNGTNIDLFVSSSDGGDADRITDTGDAAYPVWGPEAIAFAKLIPYGGWGRHEIWRIRPDGSGLETISGPPPKRFLGSGWVGLIPVGWSDDGRALLGAWSG